MKLQRTKLAFCSALAVALLLVGATQAHARHILAATLSWTQTGPTTITFTPIVYFRASSLVNDGDLSPSYAVGDVYCEPLSTNGLRMDYGDGNITPELCFRILEIGPPTSDWIKTVAVPQRTAPYTNTLVHTYPGGASYNAALFGCCRILPDMYNRVAESFYLRTTVMFTGNGSPYCSTLGSSPAVANIPPGTANGFLPWMTVPQSTDPSNQCRTFQMLATDPEGSSLTWSMATNTEATGNAAADGPPGISISPSGLVTWCNYGLPNIDPYTVQFYASDGETKMPIDWLLFLSPEPFDNGGNGCTGTIGYWKNHPDAWPAPYTNSITIGGVLYTKSQAIGIMNTPGKGDKTYDLFNQLVAATLNVASGANGSCVVTTIQGGNNFLNSYPVGSGVKASSTIWQTTGGPLHTTLDDYNNGKLCAPHRDSPACQGSTSSQGKIK